MRLLQRLDGSYLKIMWSNLNNFSSVIEMFNDTSDYLIGTLLLGDGCGFGHNGGDLQFTRYVVK